MVAWTIIVIIENVRGNGLRKYFGLCNWYSLCMEHFSPHFHMVASFHHLGIIKYYFLINSFLVQIVNSLIHSLIHSTDGY